ncbi:Calpain-type cysteine protease DEK1 [Capsicum baccatum]|uniref:Calpain-type cysteine protease DEK1 n=1 Tax=Capsicum baccatum TaxID=33114 RepID=A0A2G2V8G3_CAPBA|nr:Calpain-type cysteine protease DEK1 [Capsicum baccatum]
MVVSHVKALFCRWHIITLTIDAELGEATCYLDGNFDGYQTGLPLRVASCIWELGTDVWVGIRPPIDVDSFERSDSEGVKSKVHIMDVFLWGRCLTEDEIASLPAAMGSAEYSMIDLPDDNWQWADSPTRVDGWDSDPADVDLYDIDDVDWDGQYSSGRKRRSDRDGVVLDVDSFTRRLRKPRVDTQKEINQHMLSVEIAVKEALLARGESYFTDQEFPPNDRSLFMDPDNPPSKLQFFRQEVALEVHQNSTCGAVENVGTAAKPNGIMHEPVRADRPNAFSNNNSSVLSCIQTAVDIPSQTVGPSTFELPDHALVGPGREGGVRVGESPTLLGSELPKILSLHNQPSLLTLETDRAAVENVFNLKGIRALHLGLLYVGSLVVLLVYSILYGLTAKESNWLGATTSAAVIILVVASVLLGAAVSQNLSVTDPLAARRDALQSTVIRLREGFRRKDQNSSASSSEVCGSSVKRSSSADAGHLGNATVPCTGDGSTWNNIEGFNSDKSIDSGRPSLAPRSSSGRSVVQEPEVGSSYVDRYLEHNSSLVVCSSSGLESQGGDSSTSTFANQQILDLNLALAFQKKLSDPRITSMLKRKGRHTDRELANLLQDKGLDPNFAVMLKENGLDPMILALLQRSSLDADREHRDSNPPVIDSSDVEDVLPNHNSFSEELRFQGLGKWRQHCRVMLYHVAGTPERAWLLFSLIFILETVIVAIFRPKTIKLLNATHQQVELIETRVKALEGVHSDYGDTHEDPKLVVFPYKSDIPRAVWNPPLTRRGSPQPKCAARVGVSDSDTP